MNKILLILLINWLCVIGLSAQGWIKTYEWATTSTHSNSVATQDGGYILLGTDSTDNDIRLHKVDAHGVVQWTYNYSRPNRQEAIDIELLSDGSCVVIYSEFIYPRKTYLLRVSSAGQFVANHRVGAAVQFESRMVARLRVLSDNEWLIPSSLADSVNNFQMHLAKIDSTGTVLWETVIPPAAGYSETAVDVTQTTDNNYLLLGRGSNFTTSSHTHYLSKIDTSGTILWQQNYPNASFGNVFDITATRDGGSVVASRQTQVDSVTSDMSELLVARKYTPSGQLQWQWRSAPRYNNWIHGIIVLKNPTELPNGDFVFTGSTWDGTDKVVFIKLSSTGQLLIQKEIAGKSSMTTPIGLEIYPHNIGNRTIGYTIAAGGSAPANYLHLLRLDSLGQAYSNQLTGYCYQDLNFNCVRDTGEPSVSNHVVAIQDSFTTHYAVTDSTGRYTVDVGLGIHGLSTQQNNPYWLLCPSQQTVNFDSSNLVKTADIGFQANSSCPALRVDMSAPFLRRCFNSTYTVTYENRGTLTADSAYVEVYLDPYLSYVSSTLPLVQQTGNIYRFEVGNLVPLQRQSFQISVYVDCDSTVLGQVHCTEAHMYPDSTCLPINWTGPIVELHDTCTVDSVSFLLRNVGSGMTMPQPYVIIEEHVMIRSGVIQLGSGADTTITVRTLPGRVYRLEVAQATGFPSILGDTTAIKYFMSCGDPVILNTPNILGQFYNGNRSPVVAVDCQPNIGAYDPNDKQAQPEGYGVNQYIAKNTPLNYHIRFQNTGTDTAFTVVVVDTLDAHLDPATIRMGASSHNYTWELHENGILIVRFDNIQLPDSNVNEPLSHGFFKFGIDQDVDLPDGTQIFNDAAIYFDFNAPIITNEVFHTIGSNFVNTIITSIDERPELAPEVRVYPNPFADYATFEILDGQYQQVTLELYSATGQLVQQQQVEGSNQLVLQRQQLPSGIYFYRLEADQQLISTGKVILK